MRHDSGRRIVPDPGAVTDSLRAWTRGDPEAAARLYQLIYSDLRRQAAQLLRRERRAHTLQPTALVHEAYLRLLRVQGGSWPSRACFFAMAARVMRHVLVDHARRRRAAKREGGLTRVTCGEDVALASGKDLDVIALEGALEELARLDPQQLRVVELRVYAGLSAEEIAEALGVSATTVKREWSTARAWLRARLGAGPAPA